MLPAQNRLQDRQKFQEIFEKGQGFFTKTAGIKYLKEGPSFLKIGITVPTKVSKKAVVRNKIKRRIREVLRRHLPEIRKGYSVVIIAGPPIISKTFSEIEKEIIFLLKKTKLLQKKNG